MNYRLTILALLITNLVISQSNKLPQPIKSLTLQQAITVAKDSSLNSFVAKNLYLSGYWQYRTYKAERLPSMNMDMTPFSYNQNFIKRYDSENNVDVYKSQQSLYSYANLSLKQNVDITGGSFYIDTELGYLLNMGLGRQEQFSSVPFRFGYSQALFGFNSFKWAKKLEPVRYEKAKKNLIYNLEEISEQTSAYFFDLELSQKLFDLAQQNVANSDTLYQIGMERYKIGTISQSDLLTLKLETINSKNDVENANINLKKSTFTLASYLRLDREIEFKLQLPTKTLNILISADDVISKAKENNPTFPALKENKLSAQQNYEQTLKESRFSASLSASVGFNQVASDLSDAYRKPLQQDMVSINLKVPLVDWGVRKGKVNIARQNLNAVNITAKQTEQTFEQDLLMTVYEFNLRQSQIQSAEEAKGIAELAYNKTKQLFFIGKTDVNGVNMAISRQIEAERNYISALKNYWLSYYKIRKLTLYDFVEKKTISVDFKQIQEL
jgi:outer membrane protein TolC